MMAFLVSDIGDHMLNLIVATTEHAIAFLPPKGIMAWQLLMHEMGRDAFDLMYQPGYRLLGRKLNNYMHMVRHPSYCQGGCA